MAEYDETTKYWECPHCNCAGKLTEDEKFSHEEEIDTNIEERSLRFIAISCPNTKCHKLYLRLYLKKYDPYSTAPLHFRPYGITDKWQLLPESNAKTYPDYIPEAIRQDYEEACKIRDLSPKASATLARRCLQGVIRDFWGAKGNNLYEEINALQAIASIDSVLIEAFHNVRSIGNIGAHMEKDINYIIDVDPGEAVILIELIEMVLNDTYIAREKRKEQFSILKFIAKQKEQEKEGAEK